MKYLTSIIAILFFSCTNYNDEILSLQESLLSLEKVNEEQSNQLASLQEQINEIKRQQEEDRLAAESYVNSAIASISQLATIIEGLSFDFLNQSATLRLLQVDIETIEEQIINIESQLELIDSTGDISAKNDLLEDIENNIEDNSGSIASLISRISNLELVSEKYDSDIIGCFYLGDYTFKILENGIGFYESYDNFGRLYITFIWEKVSPNEYKFVFPDLWLQYSNMSYWITGGTYLRTIISNINEIYFPLSGDIYGWVDSDGLAKFERFDCIN